MERAPQKSVKPELTLYKALTCSGRACEDTVLLGLVSRGVSQHLESFGHTPEPFLASTRNPQAAMKPPSRPYPHQRLRKAEEDEADATLDGGQ